MPRPRPGNRCGLMALLRTILLLRAYVANASIVNAAFWSSVIAIHKNRKLMRWPRGARNQRVTVRPKMAPINLKVASACFQRGYGFLEFEVEGVQKREGVMMCWFFLTLKVSFQSQNSQNRRHRSDGVTTCCNIRTWTNFN